MDKNSIIGEVLEKGQNAVANTMSNTATNTASDISQTVSEQLGFKSKTSQTQNVNQTQAFSNQQNLPQNPQAEVSDNTREIVDDFYSPSDNTNSNSSSNNSQNTTLSSEPQIQAKLAKVRQELHKEVYYDPLIAYEQKKQEPTKAEVMEQAESQKMQELAISQQKQNADIATTRAKIAVEANRGVAG